MPMSEYVRSLRERVGTTLLEVPTASVVTFDTEGRVLLVRHIEGDVWTTPGGMIEPAESPSDAAVREMFEETGLFVELIRLVAVFGGEICQSTYGNGDRIAWVCTLFEGRPVGGAPCPDQVETLEVRYFRSDEVGSLKQQPHVRMFVDAAAERREAAIFQPATWKPAALR